MADEQDDGVRHGEKRNGEIGTNVVRVPRVRVQERIYVVHQLCVHDEGKEGNDLRNNGSTSNRELQKRPGEEANANRIDKKECKNPVAKTYH